MVFETATSVGIFVGVGLLAAGVAMWVVSDRRMLPLQTGSMSLVPPPASFYSSRYGSKSGGRRR